MPSTGTNGTAARTKGPIPTALATCLVGGPLRPPTSDIDLSSIEGLLQVGDEVICRLDAN
jgi:hypothetical protein